MAGMSVLYREQAALSIQVSQCGVPEMWEGDFAR
jgi:hypothetical protein